MFSGKKLFAQTKVASKSFFLFIPQDLKTSLFFQEISFVQNKVAIFAKTRVSEGVDFRLIEDPPPHTHVYLRKALRAASLNR